MSVTAHMHDLCRVKAFESGSTGWAEFLSKQGDIFVIFMPFQVAAALECEFNAAMEAAKPKQVAA